jgi:hypothetical protein
MTMPAPLRPDVEACFKDTVEPFVQELHPHLEAIVHKYCDEAYGAIMDNVQDYLLENATSNIKARFDAQHRELISALRTIDAIYDAIDFQEAKDHAYAARKGYWSPEKAAQYRSFAEHRAAISRAEPQP